ncbi:MAG: 3-oxoacyl-[acyl-carrier-protein] reductase [Deltaproteobacteria bacterium]|nr:3-oxoacyl-[acyl-carrier-protein] reductase [Deltaproteobacteria bacterium]MBM4323554.1 3-oxoacyl-[acyl-carrier-protein] reductase [Deltaproteobacteria bacterium]MBM4346941.1 3-oxoacyl-[acyl-carrier-protein] reductase [Deltaproteobacteria bacterium]
MELSGKVALVTGGAQGIGKAIALLLANNGADVAISDINLEKAQETANEIQALGKRSIALKANVADFKEVEQMVETIVGQLGRIDILVNNAGITRDRLILRMTEEDWDAVLDVNLKGTFNCTKAAIRYMSKQKSGKIVSIASVTGEMGNAGQANYGASKAGVIGFTKTIAREFATRGINVNAIAPGYIQTAMTEAVPDKAKEMLKQMIPMERLGQPEDVAQAVLFFVSERSSYITGQVLNVNGGIYM